MAFITSDEGIKVILFIYENVYQEFIYSFDLCRENKQILCPSLLVFMVLLGQSWISKQSMYNTGTLRVYRRDLILAFQKPENMARTKPPLKKNKLKKILVKMGQHFEGDPASAATKSEAFLRSGSSLRTRKKTRPVGRYQ